MFLNTLAPVSTKHFSWDGKQGTAFASDIPGFRAQGQLVLRSHTTGALVDFVLTNTSRDRENDVQLWSFRSANGVTLTVFND